MKPEKQQEIALMRYGAVAPLIAGLDENYPSKTAFYTEVSNKGINNLLLAAYHLHDFAILDFDYFLLEVSRQISKEVPGYLLPFLKDRSLNIRLFS